LQQARRDWESRGNDPMAAVQIARIDNEIAHLNEAIANTAGPASRFGWIAFIDILVFFGVLLVGFAYLWKRGDLDWVRSTAAERAAQEGQEQPAPLAEAGTLVGAGQSL